MNNHIFKELYRLRMYVEDLKMKLYLTRFALVCFVLITIVLMIEVGGN